MPLFREALLPATSASRGASQPVEPTAALDPYILNFTHTLSCPHRYVKTSCCGACITAGECRIHTCIETFPHAAFQTEELCPVIPDSHRTSCKCGPISKSILPLNYTSESDDGDDLLDPSQPVELTGTSSFST